MEDSTTNRRARWADVRAELLGRPGVAQRYPAVRRAHEIGDQVRRLREAQGISQTELARRMGTVQPAIARLEAGGVDPTLDTLERVGQALGVDLVVEFRPRTATLA